MVKKSIIISFWVTHTGHPPPKKKQKKKTKKKKTKERTENEGQWINMKGVSRKHNCMLHFVSIWAGKLYLFSGKNLGNP